MSAQCCAAQMTLVDHEDEDRDWLMRSLARERYFSLACGGPNVVPIVATVTAPLVGEGDAHDALASVCKQHAGSSSQPHDPTDGNVTGQAYFFFMPLAEYGVLPQTMTSGVCSAAGNVTAPTADQTSLAHVVFDSAAQRRVIRASRGPSCTAAAAGGCVGS